MAGRQMLPGQPTPPDSKSMKPSLYPSQAGWPMLAKLEYSCHIPKQDPSQKRHCSQPFLLWKLLSRASDLLYKYFCSIGRFFSHVLTPCC